MNLAIWRLGDLAICGIRRAWRSSSPLRHFAISPLLILLLVACNEVKISDTDIPIVRTPAVDAALTEEGTVLVDARKPEAYAAGHLPNAVNIYLPEIRENDARLARARRIIVYAASMRDPLGIAAAKRLAAMGYVNIQEYKGGVQEWKDAGRELVGSLPAAKERPETTK